MHLEMKDIFIMQNGESASMDTSRDTYMRFKMSNQVYNTHILLCWVVVLDMQNGAQYIKHYESLDPIIV